MSNLQVFLNNGILQNKGVGKYFWEDYNEELTRGNIVYFAVVTMSIKA